MQLNLLRRSEESFKHKSWTASLCVALQSILNTQDGVDQQQIQHAGTPAEMRLFFHLPDSYKQCKDKP